MGSLIPGVVLLLLSIGYSEAKVEFSFSTVYDIYDFQGVKEIPLPHCDLGCLIFASTSDVSDDGIDPYLKHMYVNESARGQQQLSIADVAKQFQQGTSQKLPLDIADKGKYVLVNQNWEEATGKDVTVWVIQRAKAHEFDYEIYDAAAMNRVPAAPNSAVTIMSSERFTVYADKGEANSYTARLVGFDNAFNSNPDQCDYVHQTPAGSSFDGFQFPVDSPIISFIFAHKKKVALRADANYLNTRKMTTAGFIASPGYHGCTLRDDDQMYRSKQYLNSGTVELRGEPDFYQVNFYAKYEIAKDNEIEVIANGETVKLAGGRFKSTVTIPEAQIVTVNYKDITAPQSFLLRYTSTLKEHVTLPTTTQGNPGADAAATSTAQTTTTSGVGAATGLLALALVCCKLLAL